MGTIMYRERSNDTFEEEFGYPPRPHLRGFEQVELGRLETVEGSPTMESCIPERNPRSNGLLK